MLSGAGVASADEGSSSSDSSPSSSTPSSSDSDNPNSGTSSSGSGANDSGSSSSVPISGVSSSSTRDDEEESTGNSNTKKSSSTANDSPATSISASGGNVVTKVDGDQKFSSVVGGHKAADDQQALAPATSETLSTAQTATPPSSFAKEQESAEPEPVSTPLLNLPVSSLVADPVVSAARSAEPGPADSSAIASVLALSTQASAVDPEREAYLQQFRDVDPYDLYQTPASADYTPQPREYTDEEYPLIIADNVDRFGTTGFTQTPTGGLQYTNFYSETILVAYGRNAGAEVSGVRLVAPGQTVVVPGLPEGAVAIAQAPRSSDGSVNIVGIGAVGYAPFTGSGVDPTQPGGGSTTIPTYASSNPLITQLNAIILGNSFSTVVNYASALASVLGFNIVNNALSLIGAALTGHSGNYGAVAAKTVQWLGSVISSNAVSLSRVPGLGFAGGIVYGVGAIFTTYGYVVEQATYIDPNSLGTTADFIRRNPGVAVQELANASVKVAVDLGSAFIGSLGGLFKIFG